MQDRPLAVLGEGDSLVRPLDALLDPGLLRGVGDVHEFDAERGTVGALQDGEHLADGRELQPEHVVDEDAPVVIGLGEAVGLRRQLVVVLERLGDAERIQIGVQVAAHAVGADHHDGANRIARRLQDLFLAQARRAVGRLGLQLAGDVLLD